MCNNVNPGENVETHVTWGKHVTFSRRIDSTRIVIRLAAVHACVCAVLVRVVDT